MTTTDEIMSQVPPKLRPKVAEAVNTRARATKAYDVYMAETRQFRAHLRSLHHRHGMSKAQLSRVFGIGPTRVRQIVEGKG